MNWYAIYTKPKTEDIVSQRLRQAGIEVYNPKLSINKYIRNRYWKVIESLFPCYVFGKFEPDTHLWMVKYTRGVRRVIGGNNGLWPIAEEIIDLIRHHEKEGFVTIKEEDLKKGDNVKIADGPFAGLTGIFRAFIKGSKRVLLLLHAIEYQARVIIDGGSLRKVC